VHPKKPRPLIKSLLVAFSLCAWAASSSATTQPAASPALAASATPKAPDPAASTARSPNAEERPYSKNVSTVLEDGGRILTMLAIAVGGAWVYFNFFRGRTYRPRLELSITGVHTFGSSNSMMVLTASLRNVGLSRVAIAPKGTVCTVSALPAQEASALPRLIQEWEQPHVSRILSAHEWIEPGETVVEQLLVALPSTVQAAYRVTARVVAADAKEWNAMAVVLSSASESPPIKA
jgi:hypothetical protein